MEMTRNELEHYLRQLRPCGLDGGVITRMEFALEMKDVDEVTEYETDAALRDFNPAILGKSLQGKLLAIVAHVPFRLNDKVLMFPAGSREQVKSARGRHRSWYAAAACMVLGTTLAFVFPIGSITSTSESFADAPFVQPPQANQANITASSFKTELEDVEDRGVIWSHGSQPMRMLRVAYQDTVLVREPSGVDRRLTLPREEVILFPEKID